MLKRRQMHYLISLRIGLLPQQSHISLSIGLDRLHMDSQGYFLLKFLGNLVWSEFRPYIKMCFITAQWSTARQRNHKETIGCVWFFLPTEIRFLVEAFCVFHLVSFSVSQPEIKSFCSFAQPEVTNFGLVFPSKNGECVLVLLSNSCEFELVL